MPIRESKTRTAAASGSAPGGANAPASTPAGPTKTNWPPARSWPAFILLTIALLWIVHAAAFFSHEYGHSFTAWLLGWKTNPLALNYGGLNPGNLLLQFDIDENVEYDPIFAAGHGVQAAVIALAGVVIGNGLSYLVGRWGYKKSQKFGMRAGAAGAGVARTWALAFYWLCVGSVGNFIAYVPTRTFASHADMHTAELGLHCSPWWIIVLPGILFFIALIHFVLRFAPDALRWIFPASPARRVVMVVLTAMALFGFYGASVGWSGYGPTAHALAVIWLCVLLPLSILLGTLSALRRLA